MKTKKRILALLLASSMLLLCAACGSGKNEDPYGNLESTGGKDVVRAEAADDVFSLNCNENYSFNPLIATNHSNQLVCNLVYENIVELDDNFNAIPNLLENWQPNEDATYWTFDIVQGHTFHDGTPVTGRDIRYSIDNAINADRFRGRFAAYQGSGYDDEHFYISLGIGNAQIYKLLNIPLIQYGSMTEKFPIGSGPYTYNEEHTELHAYEGYSGFYKGENFNNQLPVDTIYLKQYTTAESILDAYEDGIIDVVTNDPSSYTNLGYASTNEIHSFATTNYHFVAFNQDSVLGKYNGFRQAMNYAFDREYFAEDLAQGNAVASAVPMVPNCSDYPEELADSLAYDLELCKVVLENTGIRDYDEDGLLEYMSGSPQEIEVNFIVCSDSSVKAGVARRFQEDMASIGLTVVVRELTWDEYNTALEEGDFDMFYGEVKLRNDFDLTELLDEDSDLNYSRIKDSTFVSYINDYLKSADGQRPVLYDKLCRYISDSGALISIGFEKQQIILHRRVVKGVNPNMGNPLYDFENWEIILED